MLSKNNHLQWGRFERLMMSKKQLTDKFQHMVGSEDTPLVLLDVDGTILTWNKGVQTLKGYSSEEIIGQHIGMFYLPLDRQKGLPENLLEEARSKGKAVRMGRRIRKNGSIFWGCIEITAIKNEHDAVIGFTKYTREIKAETEDWNFWFDIDGVLHLKTDRITYTPEKVLEFRKLIADSVQQIGKISLIADVRNTSLTDEGMEFSKESVSNIYKAIACISSPKNIDEVTSKFAAAFSGTVPIDIFETREAAKKWISKF